MLINSVKDVIEILRLYIEQDLFLKREWFHIIYRFQILSISNILEPEVNIRRQKVIEGINILLSLFSR